jgi:hypothetical protein
MSAKPGSDCVASDSEIEIKRNEFNGLSCYDGGKAVPHVQRAEP